MLIPNCSRGNCLVDFSSKTIALVGNAESILAARHGADIDGHDIVVRMNRGLPKAPLSQGSRTDVLMFSVFPHVEAMYREFNASAYYWMSPKKRDEARATGNFPPGTEFYPLARWERLAAALGARPSVGAMALDMLSTTDARSVSVFGFDFKRTKSTYQDVQHAGPHDYAQEQIYCTALLASRGWRILQDF